MALIKCPDCGKEISDTASACVNCGRKTGKPNASKHISDKIVWGLLIIVLIVGGWVIYKSNVKKSPSPEQRWADAKDSLSTLRAYIQVYYGDNNGKYPESLDVLAENKKYIDAIPYIQLPGHLRTNSVHYVSGGKSAPQNLTDSGGWAYYPPRNNGAETAGQIIFNCTHRDHAGRPLWDY